MPVVRACAPCAAPLTTHVSSSKKSVTSKNVAISETALAYLKESSGMKNMVFKPAALAAEWTLVANPGCAAASNMHRLAKDAKNLGELAALPGKGVETGQKLVTFIQTPSLYTFGDVLNKVCDFFVPFADVVKTVSDKISPLGRRAAQMLSLTAAGALVTTMSFGTLEELGKIEQAEKAAAKGRQSKVYAEAQAVNSLFNIIRNSSFQSLGAITLAAAVVPISLGWPMTALATNGLFFTLLGHFHKKTVLEPAERV
ncbi:MAG: hypothetical protein KGZ39_00450 [Simkania sp.]|nr:hypothetical protein [Simkania sp.]